MAPRGYLSLVLHAHLPYVRHPEHPEFLEEKWLFEALTESYLPLLMVFDGLLDDGVDFRLSMSLTPTLSAMLDDALLRERYLQYLDGRLELAGKEVARQRHHAPYRELAEFYLARLERLRSYYQQLSGGVTGAFRGLLEAGRIEFLASAATHALLPAVRRTPAAVRAQVKLGVESHQRLFGEDPAGFWLPECAYHPGLDEVLAAEGIRYFILETHGVIQGSTRTRYGAYAPIACPSGVAAFARDPDSSKQVWSAEVGYPGNPDYRDFYRDIGFDLPIDYVRRYIGPDDLRIATGIKYHRVTGRGTSVKEPYSRDRALERAEEHAEDFLRCRQAQVAVLSERMDRRPVVVAPYDAELFGHWWFEGPEWLDFLLRKMAREPEALTTATPSEYLAEYPEAQLSLPSMSSWGQGGCFQTWLNESTGWIFPFLHRAGEEMEELAYRYQGASGARRRVLDQAARELLLAQASDWPFIIKSGTAVSYASRRVREHLGRFESLAGWSRQDELAPEDERRLAEWEKQSPIFPELSFEVFLDGREGNVWAAPREPRRIAFLAAEAVPFVKVGGLADVMGALPLELAEGGLESLVLLPAYGSVDRQRWGLRPLLEEDLVVDFGGRQERFRLLEADRPSPGVRWIFIEHPGFFGRPGIYLDPKSGEEYPDSAERFIFFTRAAMEALRALGDPIDVVHCNDHHTSLAPAYLKLIYQGNPVLGRAASVITIHNLGYQGTCSPAAFGLSGLGTERLQAGSPFEHHGRVNLLKSGIVLADKVNVVSETYAREICSDPALGAGLEQVLSGRGGDLVGILNGIDIREWDPSADPYLPAAYSVEKPEGKRECKRVMLERVGLPAGRIGAPVAAMITRLVDQKGLDLVSEALWSILDLGVDLVVLGTGLPKYHEFLQSAAKLQPGRVAVILKFDNALAHLIEAGADLFLMPSLYEPCGLNQMYSLRYGTVPVVRSTGGLADTIIDDDATGGAGNGFSFGPYRADLLVDAVSRATRAYAERERWGRIVRAGMSADNSWGSSAGRYLDLYRDALETAYRR